MKKLSTIILAVACFTASAQTEYPYPYNPDGNNDGFVSLNDLLDLLAIFGSEYYSGVLATDSISAIMYTGQLDYWDCTSSCVALTGNWKVLDHYLVGSYRSEIVEGSAQSWWLDHRAFEGNLDSQQQFFCLSQPEGLGLTVQTSFAFDQRHCYCQTRTRGDIEDLNLCENELDECGVCGGDGAVYDCGCESIPEGDCDCDGNQVDAVGVCGGDCLEDLDGDGVCDPVLGPCEGEDFVSYHGVDYAIVETADGRCWFAENLRSESFNDGTLLSSDFYGVSGSGAETFIEINPPAFTIVATGHVYNGGALGFTSGGAEAPKNICPIGWHIPARVEWQDLVSSYSQNFGSYVSMWSADPGDPVLSLYESSGSSGLNLSPTASSEQYCCPQPTGSRASYWTSTPGSNPATLRYITYLYPYSSWYQPNWNTMKHGYFGYPIRCIKD